MNKGVENIRNFVITAHIDHGKSTLADRLLEATGTVEKRLMQAQYLDSMDLERERGITIKMAPVRMSYTLNAIPYTLNLIDTPGHSDFAYEVSRALTAVEGAVLLVDAQQGIQAQTLANYENAKRANLKIIGAVNKVDVAEPDQIQDAILDLAELIGVGAEEILKVSGKTGEGVDKLLETIVRVVPPPRKSEMNVGRALVFDSLYDEHKGVIAFIRVFDGSFRGNQDIRLIATNTTAKAKEIGFFTPKLKPSGALETGETGYIATGIKDPDKLKIGDTLVGGEAPALVGYKEPKPVVFVSFYPEEGDKYDELKQALGKLRLTDSALTFEADASEFLGRGFKGGFLGKLHFEITSERLEREFKIPTVHSFPSVAYKVDGKLITNPKDFPNDYGTAEEPMTKIEIVTPAQYLGAVLQLKEVYRITNITTDTLKNKILIRATLPLSDLIRDLDDQLKSVSHGFASFYYELVGYERSEVAKLEIAVAEQTVPGLTRILPKKDLEHEARSAVEKLKELLPKQQFSQALQAISAGRIIARETISAMKKDLGNFGKNGGDRTRKMKLWKKQDRGKERLKERGESSQIKISANVFKELLKK
ncbi:MAG: translation elongation factor 4 [Patescibacteria group bacterium]